MDLYLIRHTTPDVPAGVCYGQTEIGLADSFAAEAAAVRDKLAGVDAAMCYSSPLQRCARLAATLSPSPQHDERLKELHFGDWEMRAWDAIARHQLDEWGNDYVEQAPPGGETFRNLHARATAFLRELAAQPPAGPVLAVSHAGVIRALLAEALHLPLSEAFRFQLDYGSVTRLQWNGSLLSVGYVNR